MVARDLIKEPKDAEEGDTEKKKKMSAESSIFSSILADIEDNPTILQKQKKLNAGFSVFPIILADNDEEKPTIPQKKKKKKKLKKTRRRGSKKPSIDVSSTVLKTLTRSDLVDVLHQELKILKSETEIKGQTSDRFVSRNSNCERECDSVEEVKVEQPEEVKFLADEVLEWISRGDLKSDISTNAEDSVSKLEDCNILETLDEMLSTMLGDEDEDVDNAKACREGDEFIEEMLEKIEKDGSYLERTKDDYLFGWLLEDLLRDILREKAEMEEKDISSWISNGESEVEAGVAEEKMENKRDIKEEKKVTPMVVKKERTEQESTVTKRDCLGYTRRLHLIEKLRERDEKLKKRRVKAARFGMELSFLVAEYMLLIPNEPLAGEIEDFRMCLKQFVFNVDGKGTSVIIRKLDEVFEIVIMKKENKEHIVNLPESFFRFEDYIRLCADAIQVLGKIVWALRSNQSERLKVGELDCGLEDCQKLLMKIELKLAEMKQQVYRSVSADYESFSKSERFDSLLGRKLMQRVNADNGFGRSVIGSYVVEIWRSLFQAEEKKRMIQDF